MPTLEPTVALETCENALRQLMTSVYQAEFGSDWLNKISTDDQRNQWAERAKDEGTTRKGVASVPPPGLAYAQFYELLAFADRNWHPLAAALGKKASTYPLLSRFDNLRNTVAHHRPLLPFEQELYSGIAGQIRNQVTIYMSSQDPAGEYYPRFESASDSFGNGYVGNGPVSPLGAFVECGQVLHPGETVRFTLTGVDPQGRPLTFKVAPLNVSSIPVEVESKGGVPADVNWVIAKGDVGQLVWVTVTVAAKDAEYHRQIDGSDDKVSFSYRIDPPPH